MVGRCPLGRQEILRPFMMKILCRLLSAVPALSFAPAKRNIGHRLNLPHLSFFIAVPTSAFRFNTLNLPFFFQVVLETEITNKPALRLYENLGFVRDKRLFRYYLNGVDALRLKLWFR